MVLENKSQQLREHYLYMMEHIELLSAILQESTPVNCLCFSLPPLSKEDLGEEPDVIPVETLNGQHALNMAIAHLSQHELKDNMPGVFSPRLPGVITLSLGEAQTLEVHQRINTINMLKTQFASLVKALSPNTDVRFEIVAQVLPNLIKKSVTRKILVAPEHCKRIGFTWKRFYSVRTKTPQEWDKYLVNAIKKGKPKGCEQGDWEQAVEMERQILRNNGDAKIFTSRRPIRITPAMNITIGDGGTSATTIVAHSPLWVFNQTPNVGTLNTFNVNKIKRQIHAREEILLIPRLHLYR